MAAVELNYDNSKNAQTSKSIEVGDKLYTTWVELDGIIRVARLDELFGVWTFIDGNTAEGLAIGGHTPQIASDGTYLYIVWGAISTDISASHIEAKKYNISTGIWSTMANYGNYRSINGYQSVSAVCYNGSLYVSFIGKPYLQVNRLLVIKYNSNNTWTVIESDLSSSFNKSGVTLSLFNNYIYMAYKVNTSINLYTTYIYRSTGGSFSSITSTNPGTGILEYKLDLHEFNSVLYLAMYTSVFKLNTDNTLTNISTGQLNIGDNITLSHYGTDLHVISTLSGKIVGKRYTVSTNTWNNTADATTPISYSYGTTVDSVIPNENAVIFKGKIIVFFSQVVTYTSLQLVCKIYGVNYLTVNWDGWVDWIDETPQGIYIQTLNNILELSTVEDTQTDYPIMPIIMFNRVKFAYLVDTDDAHATFVLINTQYGIKSWGHIP